MKGPEGIGELVFESTVVGARCEDLGHGGMEKKGPEGWKLLEGQGILEAYKVALPHLFVPLLPGQLWGSTRMQTENCH